MAAIEISYPACTDYRKKNGLDPLGKQDSSLALATRNMPHVGPPLHRSRLKEFLHRPHRDTCQDWWIRLTLCGQSQDLRQGMPSTKRSASVRAPSRRHSQNISRLSTHFILGRFCRSHHAAQNKSVRRLRLTQPVFPKNAIRHSFASSGECRSQSGWPIWLS